VLLRRSNWRLMADNCGSTPDLKPIRGVHTKIRANYPTFPT
jgi:hypothetical protein